MITGPAKAALGIKWRRMNPSMPPEACGLYAIKQKDQWLYVGRSICIATRIKARQHPVQITQNLSSLQLSYFWCPVPKDKLARTENAQIKKLAPLWNGGTSFECWDAIGPACTVWLPLTDDQRKELFKKWADHCEAFFL